MQKINFKRLFKKAVSWAGLFFFVIAAVMLYFQLSKYPFEDIKNALFNIPTKNLIYACLSSFLGYIALSSYDYLALRYIKRKLEAWKWILVGFIGFSVSNNAGHAIVSGGTVRYRFYTRWRFRGNEIVRMVTFSGFTYLIACFFLTVVGYLLTPSQAFGSAQASHVTTLIVALGSFIGLVGYFALCAFYKKPITVGKIQLKMPSVKMAIAQTLIGSCDIVLAAFVLYFCLIPFIEIPFDIFMGVFIVAQVLGVFSQVPGGLGVFEGLFLAILPSDANTAYLFGALIAYRIIYYVLPLILSGAVLLGYEWRLKHKRRKKLETITKA